MDFLVLGARLVLVLVFTIAAAGKLADQPGTRSTLGEFGMPGRSLSVLALLLPAAELTTAAALLVQPTARAGAIAALVLLLIFGAGIAAAMARGDAPDCNCFGQLGSAPAGRGTLIRNAVIAVPAVLVVAHGAGKSLGTWLTNHSEADAIAALATLAAIGLGALCVRLLLQNRRLEGSLARVREAADGYPRGLPVGVRAPGFSLPDANKQTITLASLLGRGKPIALVFVSPDCGPCMLMLPTLARWQRNLAGEMTIALVASGSIREVRDIAAQHGLVDLLADNRAEVFEAYRATSTPSVVILTSDGRTASPMRSTQTVVEELIRRALREMVGTAPTTVSALPPEEALAVTHSSGAARSN